jgi:hypothetical protein
VLIATFKDVSPAGLEHNQRRRPTSCERFLEIKKVTDKNEDTQADVLQSCMNGVWKNLA